MLSADREEPDLVTLAGKEEELEDRIESSGSSIESGDLSSGASDLSKLITINFRTLNTCIKCISQYISYLFWRFLHWISVLLSYYASRFSLFFYESFLITSLVLVLILKHAQLTTLENVLS